MAARSNMPAIRETRPRSRGNRKLVFLLILFFITILLLLFFNSTYSKITSIEITGNTYVSEDEILEAIGIALGDQFFVTSSEKIRQRVAAIQIVEHAEVVKQFPGRVWIEVVEYPEVAYQITSDGRQEALLANGVSLPLTDISVVIDKPILSGWEDDEMKARLTETLATIPVNLLTDISEIKPNPSNVYPDKIIMYTRSHFQIETTIEKLPEKIRSYRFLIEDQLDKNVQSGVLSMLEVDRFFPFPDEVEADQEDDAMSENGQAELENSNNS